MSWQIQHEGSKGAVVKAVANAQNHYEDDVEAFDLAKGIIVQLIEKLPVTHNGVRVNAVGHSKDITRLEVEGRALTL